MSIARFLILLAVTVVVLLPTAALAADVEVLDDGISPDPVVADLGETVVFTNAGEDDVRLIDDAGRWDSGVLAPGESFRITFDVAGVVTFTSDDDTVTGTLQIGGADDSTATPADEPASDPTTETAADETTDEPTTAPEVETVDELAATGLPTGTLLSLALAGLLLGSVLVGRGRRA